jgi:hypothetical protein
MLAFDPLKIHYLVILGMYDPVAVTPFQGFSMSWASVSWAMNRIAELRYCGANAIIKRDGATPAKGAQWPRYAPSLRFDQSAARLAL